MHRRLIQLAGNSRLAFSITVLSGLFAGLLTIGQSYLVSGTIDAVFLQGRTLAQVMVWMQLILLIIAGRACLTWLNEVAASQVAVKIKTGLRQVLFEHILALGPGYTRQQQTGELTAAAVEGVEALDAYYGQYLPQLIISTLVPLSVLLIVFPLDPLSGVVLLLTAPMIPFFMYMIGKGAETVTGRQYETLSRLSAHFLDSLQGLTTLKLFGQSKAQVRNIAAVSDQFRDTTLKVLQVTFLSALVLELLATVSTAIIAVEVGLRLLYARMAFREALFILVLAPEFYLPLRMLGLRFHAGMSGTSAARRIYQILDIPLPANNPLSPTAAGTRLPGEFLRLSINDLTYTYHGETSPALEHIELDIPAGRYVALVGESGAGKSTLLSLIMRFLEPQSGDIQVNGAALRDIPVATWRGLLAWVPQKPYLLNDSLAANIRLGRPAATQEEVEKAARLAHLDEFIESLPQKYESSAGEAGARLSSGQAQRLALARAFVVDAPILLLDEPTSSLDPQTETLLEESTRRLMQGRTVITIAHRLNTVFRADQIVVLQGGRIVERGTHRDLLEAHGPYSQMVGNLAQPAQASDDPLEEPEGRLPNNRITPPPPAHPLPLHAKKPETAFLRLLGFLKGSWGWVMLAVLLSTLTIASGVALMGTSAWLISMAALHPSIADLGVSVVGVRFFGIARGVFRYLERLVSHNVTFRLLARLRVWFYENLEPLAPARLIDYQAGDLLSRIVADVETLENFYIRVVSPPLIALLIAAGTTIFLAFFSPILSLVLLALFFILGLFLPWLSHTLSRVPAASLVRNRAALHGKLVDGILGTADVLAFNRGADLAGQIAASSQAYGMAQRRLARISGLQAGLVTFLTNLGLWLALFLAIPRINAGQLTGVMLAPLALLTLASFEAVMPLPLAAQMWGVTREAAKRLFQIVDTAPEVVDPPITTSTSVAEPRWDLGIEFNHLSFAYPCHQKPVLRDVSFRVSPGQVIAIVGPSGAGKSTLAHLLLRFWDFSQGDISIAGVSIRDYAQDDVRAMIGLVSQNAHFFNTSVYENLRFAGRRISNQDIESAARAVSLDETIGFMSQGYGTLIGSHGQRLSAGERQRLAIARIILKDAPIVLLDEPTANLDPITERRVLETLFGLVKGKVTLLITHRLVGMENVDQILVMDGGCIVERGTHAMLLQKQGLYRRLWDLQNRLLVDGRQIPH